MIIFMVNMKFSQKDKRDIQKMINHIVGPTIAHSSCLQCGFYANTLDDSEVTLLQEWKSEKALENHIRSHEFRNVLIAMDHSISEPEVRVIQGESTKGVEYIKRLRMKGKNNQEVEHGG